MDYPQGIYHAQQNKSGEIDLEPLDAFFDRTKKEGTWPSDQEATVENISGVIYDNRNVPLKELAALYRSSHAFVFRPWGNVGAHADRSHEHGTTVNMER